MNLERNQNEFQQRIQAQMERFGLDAMILTAAESIFYATGYASRGIYNNGILGSTLAVMPKHGKATVICSQFEQKAVTEECSDVKVAAYPVWIYIADFIAEKEKPEQPDPNAAFALAVEVLKAGVPSAKTIGVESATLSYARMDYLAPIFGRENLKDCSQVFRMARETKTLWEIEVLRENSVLAEKQMEETARQTQVGMTEEDIMHFFNIAGFMLSKETHTIRNAHSYGEYFSTAYIPRKHAIGDGDIVRLDGGVIRKGYCSDLGRTYVVGKNLTPERAKIYEMLSEAHDIGMNLIGPGVKPSDVFHAIMKRVKRDIPEFIRGHFGHSLGCVRNEEYPFISPSNHEPFKPGMVMCVEAPFYSSKLGSFNIEDTIVITDNGIDRFTTANKSLFWPN